MGELGGYSSKYGMGETVSYEALGAMLHALPVNIFLKDRECRYVFASHYWHHLERPDDPNWTIRGKTDLDVRADRHNALIAMETDREIMRTGQGKKYTIKFDQSGTLEYMEVIKEPVFDDEGTVVGIVGLVSDITEKELLRLKLERASKVDSMTGLLNREETRVAIMDGLAANGPNSALSIAMFDIDHFKIINDTYGHPAGDAVIIALAKILLNVQADSHDQYAAGRWGGDEYMLVMPGAREDEAVRVAELVCGLFASVEYAGVPTQTLSVGVATAEGKSDHASEGNSGEEGEYLALDNLCARADRALYRAKTEGKNRVAKL